MYNAAHFAAKVCDNALGCHKDEHTPCLQSKIQDYFNGDGDGDANVPIQIVQNRLRTVHVV